MFEVYDDLIPEETVRAIEARLRKAFSENTIMPTPYTANRGEIVGCFMDGPQRVIHMDPAIGIPKILRDALALKRPELGLGKVIRCKVNNQEKMPPYNPALHNSPHVDQCIELAERSATIVYYANDADGDTVMFNERAKDRPKVVTEYARITPKAGRFVVIEGDLYHTGSHPQVSDCRLVINMNILTA